jgi:molybdopterin synthase catalytic subunit
MQAPDALDWLAISSEPLPVGAAADWAVLPACGAVVLFSGTARDHSGDQVGLESLVYEAYEEHVLAGFEAIVADLRRQWPELGRIALLHRIGALSVGDSAVVVVVSAPHRPEAFAAARAGIDALKAGAPIWKQEVWADHDATWARSEQAPAPQVPA